MILKESRVYTVLVKNHKMYSLKKKDVCPNEKLLYLLTMYAGNAYRLKHCAQ